MKFAFLQKSTLLILVSIAFLIPFSCKKSSSTTTTTTTTTTHGTGLTGKDDPSTVPQAVNIAALTGASASLPSKVDLTPYCPPVGDQGQTETCVGWATGYYAKTVSEAIALNYNSGQTNSTNNQLSAKDLFLEIPDADKGADCQAGTQITSAMDQLVSNGVATVATVPWDPSITNCSQNQLQTSWNTDAANHKIAYYRTITATVDGIKQQLAANTPVVMAIKVSNEFQNYSSGVITSATFPNPVGLHAQCIVGYDDSQGPSGAFHVVNSWGTTWGQLGGYYWIDYNTLVNQYISNGNVYYMASSGTTTTDTIPTTTTSSVDIAAWVFSDYSTIGDNTDNPTNDPTARKMWLNIYNVGQSDVSPSSNWSYYYIYYNAFNANDYGIIFHDEFSTSIAANTYSCANNDACIYNLTIPAGSNFAEAAFGDPEIYRNYFVPSSLSGYYYLVLVADPQNVLGDVNRQNNIFYTTGQLPATFANGVITSYDPKSGGIHDSNKNPLEVNTATLRKSKYNSAVSELNRNAYTPQEILSFVKTKYQSGEIKRKANAMKADKKPMMPQFHK